MRSDQILPLPHVNVLILFFSNKINELGDNLIRGFYRMAHDGLPDGDTISYTFVKGGDA